MLFIPPVALQPLPYTFSYRCNNILLSNLIGPITPTMIGYQPQPCMLLPFCIEIISRLIPGARRAPCNRHELHFSTHSMPLPIPCIPISHTLLCPGLLPAMPEKYCCAPGCCQQCRRFSRERDIVIQIYYTYIILQVTIPCQSRSTIPITEILTVYYPASLLHIHLSPIPTSICHAS